MKDILYQVKPSIEAKKSEHPTGTLVTNFQKPADKQTHMVSLDTTQRQTITGVRVRSHICDHNILTLVQRIYRIANIRAQVLKGHIFKRPALDDYIIIEFFLRCSTLLENMRV